MKVVIFLESRFNILKNYINDSPFLPEGMNIGKVKKLACSLTDKEE